MTKELRSNYFEALERTADYLAGAREASEGTGDKTIPEAVCNVAISRLEHIKECIASGIAVKLPEYE